MRTDTRTSRLGALSNNELNFDSRDKELNYLDWIYSKPFLLVLSYFLLNHLPSPGLSTPCNPFQISQRRGYPDVKVDIRIYRLASLK